MKNKTNIQRTTSYQIIDILNEGYYEIDKSWRYVYVNRQGERLAGKSKKDLIGQKVNDVFPDAQNLVFGKTAKLVMKDGRQRSVEAFYPSFNKWYKNTIYPLSNGIGIFASDITDQKNTENFLKESKMRANQLLYSSIIGIFISEFDGKIIEANDAYLSLIGYTKTDLKTGKIHRDKITHPDYINLGQVAVQDLITKGYSTPYEKVYIHKKGNPVYVLIAVSRIENTDSCIGFVIDISKQKQSELELKRNKENLEFFSETSKVLSSSLDYKTTLRNVAKIAVPFIADWCGIELMDEDGKLESVAIAHKDPAQVKWAKELRMSTPPDLSAKTGLPNVLRTGKSELYSYIDDAMLIQTAKNEKELKLLRKLQLTSIIIVPLTVKNKTIGGISFITTESRKRYSQSDLVIVEELAKRASLAIENAVLFKQVQDELIERKKTEREKKQFATLLDQTSEAVIIWKYKGPIIYWNTGAEELYGYTKSEAIGKITHNLFHTIFPDTLENIYLSLEKTGRWEGELTHRLKNKNVVTVGSKQVLINDSDGKYILETNRDITQRIKYENELREGEERLKLALGIGKIGVWDWEPVQKLFIWTDEVYAIYDVDPNIFKPKWAQLNAFILPEDKKSVEDALKIAFEKGASFKYECRIMTAKGTIKWILTHGQITRNKSGKIIRVIGAVTDVTDQKKLEQDKNDFIGIATHELKTPVTSLKAYAEVLQRKFTRRGDELSAMYLTKMNMQLDKLTSLISDLLDATKVDAGKLNMETQEFEFGELVSEVTEELQRTTQKHKLILKETSTTKVKADRERIGQVITNLISNAIKYSPNSSKILIDIKSNTDSITLCVKDYGVGIATDKQNHVFERFYRVSGSREKTFPGMGLGLYISSEIIKRHGGKIWVESQEGKGASFYFRIPRVDKTIN